VLRETTSRGLCGLVCPSRTGTLEEVTVGPWCLLLQYRCVCLLRRPSLARRVKGGEFSVSFLLQSKSSDHGIVTSR
jgi:hypothetical protein